ncbi:WD40-repeat-containing domain protein [Limtongia smithiae]|uniref:WD40-repeat-containing domain protein n=1 Tax=Limtongia smithiae TaxID=1125753 RepID=UPI0034CD4109
MPVFEQGTEWDGVPPGATLSIHTSVRFQNTLPPQLILSPSPSPSSSSSSSSPSPGHGLRHQRLLSGPGSSRARALSSRGALSPDRFIPSSSSAQLYHVDTPPRLGSLRSRTRSAPISGNTANGGTSGIGIGVTGVGPAATGGGPATTAQQRTRTSSTTVMDPGAMIANALGISGDGGAAAHSHYQATRVLQFGKHDNGAGGGAGGRGGRVDDDALLMALMAGATSERARRDADANGIRGLSGRHKHWQRSLNHTPFRVLDAPGLRDDFYTNLLAWSSLTNDLAVGLGNEVYIWQEGSGAVLLPEWIASPVACVSFGPDGQTLVVGRMDGSITCWTVYSRNARGEYFHGVGLCCIAWRPGREPGAPMEFFVGDEVGEILRFKVVTTTEDGSLEASGRYRLDMMGKTQGHSQQICGIAFNPSGTKMAVGANDNTCTIWELNSADDGPAIAPKYRWDHRAAVKALAFCPWSPSLLATGGGSNDRTIRFWHTNSGSLITSINTNAQVTSLIWSKTTREIAATFGYANPEHPIRMAVYAYPECRPVVQIPWQEDIRCLYAVLSPDGGKVCAAASDETVRFYELWQTKGGEDGGVGSGELRVADWDTGILGSDILELCEGIEKDAADVIR